MSNAVFPVMPGLTWDITRVPVWSTTVKATVSGREFRSANFSFPRYRYKMVYSVLRQTAAFPEMAQLAGFFNARNGAFDSFLFTDPDDNAVTLQAFGIGDAATAQYQLVRTFGGYVEPIFDLSNTPFIYRTDWLGAGQLLNAAARNNLLLYSEQIDNAAWSKSNVTIGVDARYGPDGSLTADGVLEDAATTSHYVSQTVTVPGATAQRTFSAFAQSINRAWVIVQWGELTGNTYASAAFNLTTGAVANIASAANMTGATATCTLVDVVRNIYRVTLTVTKSNAATQLRVLVLASPDGTTTVYAGNSLTAFSLWGAQMEGGAPAGVYIPTTSAAVSRPDYTLSSAGLVTFPAPLYAGALVNWTGAFYRRVRFEQDTAEFNQFLQRLWDLKTLTLLSVKP